MELRRIDWPTPDDPRQARRCTTGGCDYTPCVEGECWLCPLCTERLRGERYALRAALARLVKAIDTPGLSETEWDRTLVAARAALAKATGG